MAHNHDHHGHSHDHNHSHSKSSAAKLKSCSKTVRLTTMLIMIFVYFIVEMIIGHITHSLTLIADSFHMLSDFIALVIALLSVWISKKETSFNTFGWVRAEILGALINSVFLIALCISIVVEAIERFMHVHELEKIDLLLYVAIGGLVINIGGLFIFGHGHSHGDSKLELEIDSNEDTIEFDALEIISQTTKSDENPEDIEASKCLMNRREKKVVKRVNEKKNGCCSCFKTKNVDLNIRAVFLHVLADALGSVVVIISALLYRYHTYLKIDTKYVRFVDPILCLVVVVLILGSTIPLLKETSYILLQSIPKGFEVEVLKESLLKLHGVIEIRNLHVWKLSDNKVIASAHIKFKNIDEYLLIINKIKNIFQQKGIFETTIEPEFLIKDENNGHLIEPKC